MTKKNNGTQKFTNARLCAIQAIYAREFLDDDFDKIVSRFLMGELGNQLIAENDRGMEEYIDMNDVDEKLFTKIVKEYQDKQDAIADTIAHALPDGMTPDKLELVVLCILRAGIAEFYANPMLDAPIIINEYTDITRSFYDGSEVRMVNAILDKFAKVIRG